MKKIALSLALVLSLLLLLGGCVKSQQPASPSELPSASPQTDPVPSPQESAPAQVDNQLIIQTYLDFLSDNYDRLSAAFFNVFSGVGFIDLDCDSALEMLIFDSGASASMGVQFFDIVDGRVECVSANLLTVKEAFGGERYSDVAVNANSFSSFRLMQSSGGGEKFFLVVSGNGASDFVYEELIRFGSDEGVLTLESLLYKYSTFDIDTGDTLSTEYKVGATPADKAAYDAKHQLIYTSAKDSGYEAVGIFAWETETGELPQTKEDLLKLAEKSAAAALSQPTP